MERWRHFARGRRCSTERSNPWRLTKLGENISKSIGNLPGRLSDFCFWLDLNVQLVLNAYIYNSCRSASTSWSNRACKRATDVSTGLVLIYPVNICQHLSTFKWVGSRSTAHCTKLPKCSASEKHGLHRPPHGSTDTTSMTS